MRKLRVKDGRNAPIHALVYLVTRASLPNCHREYAKHAYLPHAVSQGSAELLLDPRSFTNIANTQS